MNVKIPHQYNDGQIVALLPDGRVEFFDESVEAEILSINAEKKPFDPGFFTRHIISDPLVDLDNFYLSGPAIAFIEITNFCNLTCKHCYAFSGPKDKREDELTREEILDLLDQFEELGVLQVFLTGGEVFAHPNAVEIINYAKTKSFTTQIFTNGTLIKERHLSKIPEGTSFLVSFDTADPVKTVRGGMDYPILKEKFRLFEKYNHPFRTAVSVHNHNIDDVFGIFSWCEKNEFPRPQWMETHPIGRALLHKDILIPKEKVGQVIEIYQQCMDRFSKQCPQDEWEQLEEENDGFQITNIQTIKFCQRLERATRREKCSRTMVYVNSAGDVYPCSNCMSNGSHKGGNIRENSFVDIWDYGFDKFRKITFDDFSDCSTCPVEKEGIWCQFRCPPLSQNVSKSSTSCGSTEYLKEFMLRSNQYWKKREKEGRELTMYSSRV